MKAKDYAKRYEEEGRTDVSLYNIWKDMFCEFDDLRKVRHAESDAAAISIVQELDKKWRAFARMAGDDVNQDGFINMISETMPDVYKIMRGER